MKIDIMGMIGKIIDDTLGMFNRSYDEGYVIYLLIGVVVLFLYIFFWPK